MQAILVRHGEDRLTNLQLPDMNHIESHVHTLLNIVYLSGIPTRVHKRDIPELDCKLHLSVFFQDTISAFLDTANMLKHPYPC